MCFCLISNVIVTFREYVLMMMIDAFYGLSYGFHSYIIQDDSRLLYRAWYRLQMIQVSLAVIIGRPLVAFLVNWTHIWPSYRYSYLAGRWYRWMIHSDYRDPLIDSYFYLRGCVSSLYLELDSSDHCGTFAVGFLVKIAQDGLLTWPIQRSWFGGDIWWWGYESHGPQAACLCGIWTFKVLFFSMACRTCHLIISILY